MATAISGGTSFDTLPYEVKTRIFSRLPFCERIRLTRVSQSWRHFLLHWPEMFEKVENRCNCAFERDLSYTMCQLHQALLPYAPYIKPKALRDLSILMLSDHSPALKNAMLEVSEAYCDDISTTCQADQLLYRVPLTFLSHFDFTTLKSVSKCMGRV